MAYLALVTTFLFIGAAAASCYPGRQRETVRLLTAACVMMAVTGLLSIVAKGGMFDDLLAVPPEMMARAVFAAVPGTAFGTALALALSKRKR